MIKLYTKQKSKADKSNVI